MRFLLFLFAVLLMHSAGAQTNKARLNHLAIYVVDLQKTGDFYSNVIGLDTIPEPFHDKKHIWYSIGPGASLHVISGAEKPKEYFLNNHMCFSVPSVDSFVDRLKARNISWVNAQGERLKITTRVDGVKQIWVNDPDGYFIEVNDAKQ
jgi:lactoylglutathione lyase